MAGGSFDSEIRQAMAPDSGTGGKPAKSGATVAPTVRNSNAPKSEAVKAAPPKPPAAPKPQVPMPMAQGASDPVMHAAGIAHAILAHGRGGM